MDVCDFFSVRNNYPRDLKVLGKAQPFSVVRGAGPSLNDRTKWNYEYGIYVAGNYGFPQGGLPGIMMNYDGIVSLSKLLNKLLESGEIKPSVSDEQYQRDKGYPSHFYRFKQINPLH